MSNEVAKNQPSVKALIESPAYSNRLRQLLGERAPQFIASLVQLSQQYQLASCDAHSIIAAGITAASLDLPLNPGLGFAWVIPYGPKATFQIGYKGFVQLALRSGLYRLLNVVDVYEGELLKYDRVKSDVVLDETARKSDKIVGYLAYFQLLNGHEHALYWSVEEVESHAKRFSQAYRAKKQDSPWFTDFHAMARKTVLKALLSHWGPLSVQMQKAVLEDGAARLEPAADVEFPDATIPAAEGIKEANTGHTKASDDAMEAIVNEPLAKAQAMGGPTPPQMTPQGELMDFVIKNGYNFDTFRKWLHESGQLEDAMSLATFEDVPVEIARRLLRSKAGFLKGLSTTKE